MMIIFYFNLITGKLGNLSNAKKFKFTFIYSIFYFLYLYFTFYIIKTNNKSYDVINSLIGSFVFVYITSHYAVKINESGDHKKL